MFSTFVRKKNFVGVRPPHRVRQRSVECDVGGVGKEDGRGEQRGERDGVISYCCGDQISFSFFRQIGVLYHKRRACIAVLVCGIIISAMTIKDIAGSIEYRSVVNDYRDTCLWFANNVLEPKDRAQLEQVLSSIETYGDADAYRRVGRIRQWL